MKPVSELSSESARGLSGVLFDIDDTVLDHGRLAVSTLQALYNLREAGLILVGVTGRPVAWGQMLLRQWPLAGMVTENGALSVRLVNNRVVICDRLSSEQRARRRAGLLVLANEMQDRFADLLPSDDAFARQADFTFDIGETVVLPSQVIEAASQYAQARGARVTRSSIHLHLTFDGDDKATGTLRFLREVLSIDSTDALARFAFIGDSDNDTACFNAFLTTVGVANFSGSAPRNPRFITSAAMGAGFVEFATHLVQLREGRRVT